jgi:hypothetical protein
MRGRAAALAALVGLVATVLVAWLDLVAASFIFFDWGGADLFTGEAGREPPGWTWFAWVAVTVVLLAADVIVIRQVYRWAAHPK